MIELLKLCGFKEHEIESELPRVERAFEILGINADDIETGKQRLTKYYAIEMEGLRRVFRLCLRELVAAMLVREEGKKKVIYGFMSPGINMLGTALISQSSEVFLVHHSWAFHIVVGCIFGKMVPVIEEAEKRWLKAGAVAHCANVKTLLGPISLGLFPKPDLLITAGITCETSSKTLDLLHELYDIPVGYIDTCMDRESDQYPEPSMRIADLNARSIRNLAGKMQEVTGLEIKDEMMREVRDANGKLGDALSRVRKLVRDSDPLPISPAHENIWFCLSALTMTIDEITEATEAINMLYEELKEKVARGEGVVEKGAPRVMAILPAGQTDPQLEYLACEVGIAIVAIDMSLGLGFKETSDDPYIEMGMGAQQHTLGLPLKGRVPMIVDGCRKLKADGLLNRFHAGCRATVADALIIEEAVKKELGIPVLVLEWENFDPRVHNHEEYKRRFEVFRDMMMRK